MWAVRLRKPSERRMPDAVLTGGCQCGAVRYAIAGTPVRLYVCHCRECQKQSGSAFGMSLIVCRAAFVVTQGAAQSWLRKADSGRTMLCHFCAVCGSRLWHARDGMDTVSVKAGSLDTPMDFTRAVHIWTSRKVPGLKLRQDAEQYAEQPS
jgi:hypothetical protein